LERFGSVQAIMTASADDLAAVGGIGEKTAAKMRWAVQESTAAYGMAPLDTPSCADDSGRESWQPETRSESMGDRHEDKEGDAGVWQTSPDSTAKPSDIDLSLLEESLRLTPWERMLANDDALNFAESLRRAMEKRNAESQ
jgi:proteasome lid subunit RPN8/RPN11